MNNEFRKVMRELVKSNYSTLDSRKLKTIIDHFYGEGDKTRYSGLYEYDNGYFIHYPGSDDGNPHNPYIYITDLDRTMSMRFETHNLPDFITFVIRKWRKSSANFPKVPVYRITGSSVVNYPTVEETVSHFLIWVKDTHRFFANGTDEEFIAFLNMISKSCQLGNVYFKTVLNWNGGLNNMVEYKQIPSSRLFYTILNLTIDRTVYDDDEVAEKWRRAIY